MLTLFAATIFFVAGVLTREAEAAGRNGPDVPQYIGKFVGPAETGGHVHTHNLKTKRW